MYVQIQDMEHQQVIAFADQVVRSCQSYDKN